MDAIQLGKYSLAAEILASAEHANMAPELSVSGGDCLRHFSFDTPSPRCIEALEWHGDAIFVMLPDSRPDEAKGDAYKELMAMVPALAELDNVYLFPYGRSSLQLALLQAGKLFDKGTAEKVQLVGYFQDPRLQTFQQGADIQTSNSSVASECFIAATIGRAQQGFEIAWGSYEVHTSDKDLLTPISALFQRYRKQFGQPVNQLYLPVAIEEPLRDAWTESVAELETCVSDRTQVVFADIYTGDLGHVSGLYGLCHMLWRYRQGEYVGNSFQLDISSQTYRSAMMLRWSA